ncbi:hypothetical protein JYU34_004418 [Plutella xylostella]|uniref:FLYWCH-type domain-containing protein n=1 Tax=Plutella xylostella TaxID=51655 RepID=A0ABQ7QXY1_PLUXY|nr:hypothetical protein JYU34_004418 [Plutella xylostella]
MHASVCEFIPTKRGTYKLRVGNATFWCGTGVFNPGQVNKVTNWYCSKKKTRKCKVVSRTLAGHLLDVSGEHTH